MAQVTVKEINYKNYGRCLEIANGIVKIVATIDLGPRIINYSFLDGENVMFEDIDRIFYRDGAEFEKFGGGTWYTYGGHRLWVSPEGMPKSYYPDNEPVDYELLENGVRLKPQPQKWNQFVYEIDILLDSESSKVTLTHKVKNLAAWPVELALWPITVLAAGGKEIVPQPQKDTGLLSNRLLALWPYSKMTDSRVHWGDKFITLSQNCETEDAFKLGINSEHGFAMYFNHGDLFLKQFTPIEGGKYPDGGMSFETYTNALFLEMETLGEMKKLAPEASTEHREVWSLYKEACPSETENELEALVKKYVK